MLEKRQKTEVPMEIQELNNRIGELSSIISRLEDRERELNSIINNHESKVSKYKEMEAVYNEMVNVIEDKRLVITSVTKEVSDLFDKVSSLKNEIKLLDYAIAEKKAYVADVEKYKGMVVVLQKEMNEFQDKHENNKKISETHLKNIKEKIKDLHSSFTLIVNNLE